MIKLREMREKLLAKKDNKGFTLVELIVVIVILAILVGVTIGGVYGYVNKARINTDINNASAIASALAPITTMKDIEIGVEKGADGYTQKVPSTNGEAVKAADIKATTFGLAAVSGKEDSVNEQVLNMFPQGLDAPKAGGYYKITYTVLKDKDGNDTKKISSVSVQAYGSDDKPLEGQE